MDDRTDAHLVALACLEPTKRRLAVALVAPDPLNGRAGTRGCSLARDRQAYAQKKRVQAPPQEATIGDPTVRQLRLRAEDRRGSRPPRSSFSGGLIKRVYLLTTRRGVRAAATAVYGCSRSFSLSGGLTLVRKLRPCASRGLLGLLLSLLRRTPHRFAKLSSAATLGDLRPPRCGQWLQSHQHVSGTSAFLSSEGGDSRSFGLSNCWC